MENKKVKIIFSVFISLLLFFSGCSSTPQEKNEPKSIFSDLDELKKCNTTEDCIVVDSNYCGCKELGKCISINKIYENKWEKSLKDYREQFIEENGPVECGNTSTAILGGPQCIQGKCYIGNELKELEEFCNRYDKCEQGYICYEPPNCGVGKNYLLERCIARDNKCHKLCETDSNCPSGEKCIEIEWDKFTTHKMCFKQ